MLQLELFPRKEFNSLSDFKQLEALSLSLADRIALTQNPSFFMPPKANGVIQQEHSQRIDKILGFRTKYVEEMLVAEARGFEPEGSHETWGPLLHQGVQTWVGLDVQTLQTPYSECLKILQLLKLRPYQHIIDLGAAFGRMGVVIGGLYIKNSFTGYEYVRARVAEGNRIYQELQFSRCKLLEQDLFSKDFVLPDADVYFIYDYGQVEHIDHTLKQIRGVASRRPVKIVVRGKYAKKLISDFHPWLQVRYEGKFDELFSIYTVNPAFS